VLVLEPLGPADIGALIDRALADRERARPRRAGGCSTDAHAFVSSTRRATPGRARTLELAARIARAHGTQAIDLATVEEAASKRALRYDKSGEQHYETWWSAFIKSMRGGNPDAAVYWLMRMLDAGEDPLSWRAGMVVFRRGGRAQRPSRRRCRSPVAAKDAVAFRRVSREAASRSRRPATFLATCPKSNASYRAMLAATEDVKARARCPSRCTCATHRRR